MPAGIPTGRFEVFRPSTPLDPTPKGPVFDGGLRVPEESIHVARQDNASYVPIETTPSGLNPSEIAGKYRHRGGADKHTVSITIPQFGSFLTTIRDALDVSRSTGRVPYLDDLDVDRLERIPYLANKLPSAKTLHICSFVPGSDSRRGDALEKYFDKHEVKIPSFEELLVCCAVHFAATGQHLLPAGRFTRTKNGVLELLGGQIRPHLHSLERFEHSKYVVVSGVIAPGKETPITTWWDKVCGQFQAAIGGS